MRTFNFLKFILFSFMNKASYIFISNSVRQQIYNMTHHGARSGRPKVHVLTHKRDQELSLQNCMKFPSEMNRWIYLNRFPPLHLTYKLAIISELQYNLKPSPCNGNLPLSMLNLVFRLILHVSGYRKWYYSILNYRFSSWYTFISLLFSLSYTISN